MSTKKSKTEGKIEIARPKSKSATSFKLTDTALDILAELSIARGIPKSGVIENLLRDEDKRSKE